MHILTQIKVSINNNNISVTAPTGGRNRSSKIESENIFGASAQTYRTKLPHLQAK